MVLIENKVSTPKSIYLLKSICLWHATIKEGEKKGTKSARVKINSDNKKIYPDNNLIHK